MPQVIEKLSHNVVSSTPRYERDSNSQIALVEQIAVNPTTI